MSRMAARGRYYPSTGPSGRHSFVSAVTGALSKLLSSLTAVGSATTVSSDWIVSPAPSFTQGSGQTYDLTATLPALYTDGGVYAVDPTTQQLPTGMTITEAGTLGVGTATASTTNNVYFTYFEPGALTTLTLHSTSAGTFPYMATIYPLEGTVPSGQILLSPDDSTFRSSVLSTWPDGSAQVMVGAGRKAVSASSQTPIKLRPGVSSGTNMTTTDLVAVVNTVAVNFGTPLSLTLTNANHDRIWWQNPEVICARYRLPITNKGVMDAVIDVHCFRGGRAFVEVQIENGKVNANLATVVAPTSQSYTNATVSVNGVQIQGGSGVSSPTVDMAAPRSRNYGGTCLYHGDHTAFRAWYCNGWVGGDPGIEVTHDIASMMAHPWFYERAVPSAENLQTKYSQTYDTYEPWAFCRLRFPVVNGGGSDEEIGIVTATQADYLLSGNKYARRAVLATGIAPLSAALSFRHTDGSVPTRAQVVGKNTSAGTWPDSPGPVIIYLPDPTPDKMYPRWGADGSYTDGSHVPNIALVPFLCRPSPAFIELAQNEFLFHHTNYGSTDGSHSFDQARARGWRARNMATTIFLTPDSGTWTTGAEADSTRKTGYRTALVNQINTSRNFMDQAWNTYDHIYGLSLTSLEDNNSTRARFQGANYMHWLVALSWHSIANGKVLRGADQTMMEAAADQVINFPIRWFNDAPSYEWRAVPYQATVGIQSGNNINPQFNNVISEWTWDITGTAPNAPGPWLNFGTNCFNWQAGDTGDDGTSVKPQTVANTGSFYPEHLWNVLCCAVERGVSGAETAWTKVYGTSGNGGITNFSTWVAGLGNDRPYLNRFPRNK
jgi:hypothetical protein